jgi:hypothetical protein
MSSYSDSEDDLLMPEEKQNKKLKAEQNDLIQFAIDHNLIQQADQGNIVTGNIGPFYSGGGKNDYRVIVNSSGESIGVGRVLATIVNIVIIELVPGFFDDKKDELTQLIGLDLPSDFADAKKSGYYNAEREPYADWIVALPSDVILQSEIDFSNFPELGLDPTSFYVQPSSTPVKKKKSEIINYGYFKDEGINMKYKLLNLAGNIMMQYASLHRQSHASLHRQSHANRQSHRQSQRSNPYGGARKRTTCVSRKQRKQRKQRKSRKQRK